MWTADAVDSAGDESEEPFVDLSWEEGSTRARLNFADCDQAMAVRAALEFVDAKDLESRREMGCEARGDLFLAGLG